MKTEFLSLDSIYPHGDVICSFKSHAFKNGLQCTQKTLRLLLNLKVYTAYALIKLPPILYFQYYSSYQAIDTRHFLE